MSFSRWLAPIAIVALAAPAFAKPAPKKQTGSKAQVITAKQDRIKQMHDQAIKWKLGLPKWTYGRGSSEVSTKFTPAFRVSPTLDGWVTDYGEADGSAYRVRLSLIKWPDGTRRSLYTDAQKAEVFKNVVGHLYKLQGAELDRVVNSDEGKRLKAEFASKVDDGGFDFPMQISLKR